MNRRKYFAVCVVLVLVAVGAMGMDFKVIDPPGTPFKGYVTSATSGTTPLAFTLYGVDGATLTVESTDVVIVDAANLYCGTAGQAYVFFDGDADGAVDANESIFITRLAATGNVNAITLGTPAYGPAGVTPKLKGIDSATEGVIYGVIKRGP